jgi:hypothetical protein
VFVSCALDGNTGIEFNSSNQNFQVEVLALKCLLQAWIYTQRSFLSFSSIAFLRDTMINESRKRSDEVELFTNSLELL